MKPLTFDEQNIVFAKDQPQYRHLPAYRFPGPEGRIACCWRASWKERLVILLTGRIWQEILTFNNRPRPQLLLVKKPEMVVNSAHKAGSTFKI